MNIKTAIDSASNYKEITDVDFTVIPLSIHTDEREFIDNSSLSIEGMLDYLEHTKLPSHSSCPGLDKWLECFCGNDNIIAITLTGALSGCYNACQAASMQYMEDNPGVNIFPFDTRSIGPIEKLCAEYVNEHSDIDSFEVVTTGLKDYCYNHTKLGFCLKSLKNLANNGRINRSAASLAQALGIQIIGTFSADGELMPTDKIRGDKKSMQTLYQNMLKAGYKGKKVRIDHCMARETSELLRDYILSDFPSADLLIGETTGLCTYYAERGGVIVGYEI